MLITTSRVTGTFNPDNSIQLFVTATAPGENKIPKALGWSCFDAAALCFQFMFIVHSVHHFAGVAQPERPRREFGILAFLGPNLHYVHGTGLTSPVSSCHTISSSSSTLLRAQSDKIHPASQGSDKFHTSHAFAHTPVGRSTFPFLPISAPALSMYNFLGRTFGSRRGI